MQRRKIRIAKLSQILQIKQMNARFARHFPFSVIYFGAKLFNAEDFFMPINVAFLSNVAEKRFFCIKNKNNDFI